MEPSSAQPQKGMNKTTIGLIVVVLFVAVGTTAFVMMNSNPAGRGGNASAVRGNYEDGEYTANGSYLTPGGNESIDVTLTLQDNTIKSAEIVQNAISNEAKQFQGQFASGFQAEVVGKNIDEVNLSRVAGSSLTPGGFNSALTEIKNEAKI